MRRRTSEQDPATKQIDGDAIPPALIVSDEGVIVERLDHETIANRTNAADNPYDARRRELHLAGRVFSHVADAADGAWIYRADS